MTPLDPVALATALMAVDSTTGQEGALVAQAEALLAGRGWRVRRIPVGPGRHDLLAEAGPGPRVTLATHLDTVPPYLPPRRDGDALRGRGACDAKGAAASMICAAERLRARGAAVALLLLVGEEGPHDGARAAAAEGDGSRAIVMGEPTGGRLALACKGAQRFTVTVRGQAAHSAYPHLGRSAIDGLVELLHELRGLALPQEPLLGATTVNVGRIEGGVADNVVAPAAAAHLMARTVGPEAELREVLTRWVAGRAELTWGVATPPLRLATAPGFETTTVACTTDLPLLAGWGTPYLFGPGHIEHAHRDDEHVRVEELHAAVDAYERLAVHALRGGQDLSY